MNTGKWIIRGYIGRESHDPMLTMFYRAVSQTAGTAAVGIGLQVKPSTSIDNRVCIRVAKPSKPRRLFVTSSDPETRSYWRNDHRSNCCKTNCKVYRSGVRDQRH